MHLSSWVMLHAKVFRCPVESVSLWQTVLKGRCEDKGESFCSKCEEI